MVEAELDTFIARRHEKRLRHEGDRSTEEAWQLSARVHNAKLMRENAAAWIDYHRTAAERARRNLEELIARHEAAAEMLEADTKGDAA
jgi:hypothetical protein